jgi:hypothetical protein
MKALPSSPVRSSVLAKQLAAYQLRFTVGFARSLRMTYTCIHPYFRLEHQKMECGVLLLADSTSVRLAKRSYEATGLPIDSGSLTMFA